MSDEKKSIDSGMQFLNSNLNNKPKQTNLESD